ncbi:MAG: tRNA dihydrouridine(20/20a) synthase DusA [Deltaproteobacteria bacterium]|nr:tRNA dihydrouridine(20/20a) synthase DusA [Deltaproteobacteria bacterium]
MRVSIAPMMDVTDRHFRYFMRLITRRTLLYTPMIHAIAVIRGNRDDLLGYDPCEQPLAIQLGGGDPTTLAQAAHIAEDSGYGEVNLNVGCPSDRVQDGHFGACLMAEPERVAAAVAAMKSAVRIPVTVKHRVGIDDLDSYEHLSHFVATVAAAGCDRFIVHARKAWLKGLSPKENRTIPPLRYDEVYRLKRDFPHLTIVINGGVKSIEEVKHHLQHVDGVMIGRLAEENPYALATVDSEIFGDTPIARTRSDIVADMQPYIDAWYELGLAPRTITRHLLGLYTGQPGARNWRKTLSEKRSNFFGDLPTL